MTNESPAAPSRDEMLARLGLITESELCSAIGVELKTLQNWRSRRIGPPYIDRGRKTFYLLEDVMSWLRSQRRDTLDSAA